MRLSDASGVFRGRFPNRTFISYKSYILVVNLLLVLVQLGFADPFPEGSSSGCLPTEFRCDCGVPKCIEKTLVKNGAKDCADGSDEGEWDPSKCAIKNKTSEDIRFKRAAAPEHIVGKHATTTFFTNERGRTRPVGLLSTSVGAFVTSGTTTEYLTKILGTYIKGTYARIISTSSKVYHAVPTEQMGDIRPTGFITSTTSSEINGYATTVHTTDFSRTYIDGTYAQVVSSTSSVKFPSWYTDKIEPTGVVDADGATVYPTLLPEEVRGSFVQNNNVKLSRAYAEVGIVQDPQEVSPNKFKVVRPGQSIGGTELRVTGTHGKFIHTDKLKGDETTYNVFTGSYVQNSKTFLFFFGNTVIDPSRSIEGASASQTLMVAEGPQKRTMMVDMSDTLKILVPSANSKVRVDGSVGGQQMPGVLVEIEGSEGLTTDDLINVDGASPVTGTPNIDMVTITSSSSSSSDQKEGDNEIPRARKVPSPSKVENLGLPTFTVGQPDSEELKNDVIMDDVILDSSDMISESTTQKVVRAGAPVFLKPTTEKTVPLIPERIRALGYSQKKNTGSNLNGRYPMPNRSHRAFAAIDAAMRNNNVDSDLDGAASTGRATVTYVGFADFTTTVGNTVIVFMPRTKMIEDLSVHASKTESPEPTTVEPTRYPSYHNTDHSTTSTTTEETPDENEDEEHVQFSVSQVQGRKVPGGTKHVTFIEDEETTTEVNPTEVSSVQVGRETVLVGSSRGSSSVQKPKVRASSSSVIAGDKRSSLFSSPRVKFTPKLSQAPSSPVFKKSQVTPSVFQTASTRIFQTEILNPTGLVTSVDGTIVKEGKTTLYTSLVYGTFIGKSYAQVIKSTSRIANSGSSTILPSSTRGNIRPTSAAKFPKFTKSSSPVYYEVSTTTTQSSNDEDDRETTTTARSNKDLEKTTVRVSTTTGRTTTTSQKPVTEDDEEDTTTIPVNLESSFDAGYDDVTTTTEREIDNEINLKRKVAGKAKDQIIVDLEPSSVPQGTDDDDEDEQRTIYVTRTQPTTVYKTLTYFTTYFIPDGESTSTRIVSREVTSSAVGLVRKTLTSIIPGSSAIVSPSEVKSKAIRDKGSQVIYKTLYTTYTYLTTFFSGHSSSVSSREETVYNVITSTSDHAVKPTVKVTPTRTISVRPSYKTISTSPRPSSSQVVDEDEEEVTVPSSPSSSRGFGRGRSSSKASSSSSRSSSASIQEETSSSTNAQYESVTLLRTFMTTFTYFTTLFNGDDTSIKSRTEVITNIVPYVTKTLAPVVPTTSPLNEPVVTEAYDDEEYDYSSSPAPPPKQNTTEKSKPKETTFFTTYTYLSTIFRGKSSTVKTSKQTYANIVAADKTVRSGYVEPIEPTKLSGRSASKPSRQPKLHTVTLPDERDEVEDVTTLTPQNEYELEGSEDVGITTNRPENYDEEGSDDESNLVSAEKTPILKTLFTTYTFYTTYFKGGSSTVSTRLDTKSQVVTDTEDVEEATVTDKAALLSTINPTQLITYFTTFTYWTTSFKDGNSIVTSREETVENVVTPSVEPTKSSSSVKETENEIVPSSALEVELTTFYTTYTYFTSSYLGDKTVVNSRLETITNVVTGTPVPSPTQAGRAIGTVKAGEQKISGSDKDEYEDYATGLLSTIASTQVKDGTTTLYSTDVFGTLIDGIYAQVLESTSRVIQPSASVAFTRFFPGASETVTGVVSVNEGKTVEPDKERTTYYATTAYGTVIDGQYAHLVESSSSVKTNPSRTLEPSEDSEIQKTGLVRVIDGTLVEGDHTTFYTSSIVGTFVDGQYAQVIESTSRFLVNPTKTAGQGQATKSVVVDVESSVTQSSSDDEESVTTTTEKVSSTTEQQKEEEKSKKGVLPPRRFGGGRGSSRLSFTSSSKPYTPSITPFASRSRPSGFNPRRRPPAVVPTKSSEEVATPATSTATTGSRGFQPKRRFPQKQTSEETTAADASASTTPTPALPSSRGRGRFTKPPPGGKSRYSKANNDDSTTISPTSVTGSSTSGSSPGARGKSSFAPRGSSSFGGGRGRPSSILPARSSTAGARGVSSSRFIPGRGRISSSSAVINPTATDSTTVSPTQSSSSSSPNEYESDEYEYETQSQSSSTTTTEAPKSVRLPGHNRFRLSPKLSTPLVARTTTARPSPLRNNPLNVRRFTKPTLPTRGTTTTEQPAVSSTEGTGEGEASSSKSSVNEEYEEEYEAESPSSSTTTSRPLIRPPGVGTRRPLFSSGTRPTARPIPTTGAPSRSRAPTTAPTTQPTTKRTYTPRPRPAGFPKALGPITRSTTTTTTPAPVHPTDEEYYEEGEFEYQETKNLPGTLNSTSPVAAAASEISEVRVPPPQGLKSLDNLFGDNSDLIDSILKALPQQDRDEEAASDA